MLKNELTQYTGVCIYPSEAVPAEFYIPPVEEMNYSDSTILQRECLLQTGSLRSEAFSDSLFSSTDEEINYSDGTFLQRVCYLQTGSLSDVFSDSLFSSTHAYTHFIAYFWSNFHNMINLAGGIRWNMSTPLLRLCTPNEMSALLLPFLELLCYVTTQWNTRVLCGHNVVEMYRHLRVQVWCSANHWKREFPQFFRESKLQLSESYCFHESMSFWKNHLK